MKENALPLNAAPQLIDYIRMENSTRTISQSALIQDFLISLGLTQTQIITLINANITNMKVHKTHLTTAIIDNLQNAIVALPAPPVGKANVINSVTTELTSGSTDWGGGPGQILRILADNGNTILLQDNGNTLADGFARKTVVFSFDSVAATPFSTTKDLNLIANNSPSGGDTEFDLLVAYQEVDIT